MGLKGNQKVFTPGLAPCRESKKVLSDCKVFSIEKQTPFLVLNVVIAYCSGALAKCVTQLFLSTWDSSVGFQQNLLGSVFVLETDIFFRKDV